VVHTPFKTPCSQKGDSWEHCLFELKKQQAKDGSFPFANVAVSTLKKRHSEHLKLQDHWEKTPPADFKCDETKSSGKQRLSILIEHAVEKVAGM